VAKRIKVDPDELTRVSGNLKDVPGQLANTGRDLTNADRNHYPGDELPSALGHFGDKWNYALGKIAENAGVIGEGLGRSGDVWREEDDKGAKAYSPDPK
jgi:hypothetical protein